MNVILNFKSKYFDLIFAFVMAIFAFVIILNGYVQLPQRTHEIAALQYLTDINSLGHQSNFAIGTFLNSEGVSINELVDEGFERFTVG